MAVNYSTAVANARLAAVISAMGGSSQLVIGTSALSGATGVLAQIALAATPATVSARVLTLSGVPRTATAVNSGTAALAELRDGSGTTIVSGLTVGASGTDIIINAVAISSGQTVQVSAGTITHP